MDSISNLPLLEIADEDDSLLLDVPAATATATTINVFSCSPLLSSLRSAPPRTEGRENGAEIPSSSSNKENANCNKPESSQKLSIERQKMKRKKKTCGYNLRKSLAWDRAFFTEQGVLNPKELSALHLEVINEEEPVCTSSALRETEENLFTHSSDGVPVEDRKPSALAKASPASMAKRKVLAVNDVVGNRYKRTACPLPSVASSSHNTVKATSKDLKVTRIPGPTSNVSVRATAGRSGTSTAGSSKRNQNAPPAINAQKYTGVKGLSKLPRIVPSNPKADQADKCSVTRTHTMRAGKHLDNSVSKTHPQPSKMHQSRTESNKLSEACLPQGVSDAGEKKQQSQLHTTKLSGLRMPSPSLGFFSQAKAPSSHSQLQKSSKPGKPAQSNVPKLQNLETSSVSEARQPLAARIRSVIVNGAAKNCTEKLSLLDVKSEPLTQVDIKQMDGVKVKHDSMSFDEMHKQEKVENSLEHNITSKDQQELHKSENISAMVDVVFPKHEMKLLSKGHTQEQLEKEACHPDAFSNGDQSVNLEPQSINYHTQEQLEKEADQPDAFPNEGKSVFLEPQSTHHHTQEQSEKEAGHPYVFSDGDQSLNLESQSMHYHTQELLEKEADHPDTFSKESLVLQAKNDTSFKDSALLDSSLIDFSGTVSGGSIQGISCMNTEQVNSSAANFVICGQDAQVHLLNGNLSVVCSEATQSAVNQQLPGEQLKSTSPSIVRNISLTNENESHVNSCQLLHMTTLSFEGSPQNSIPEVNCASEIEPKTAKIEDFQFVVDDQSGFIQGRPVAEDYEQVIDSKAVNNGTQVLKSECFREDSITVSVIACHESRPFDENNVESLHFTSQLCPRVIVDVDSRENDISTNNCCAICEFRLRDDGSSRDASMHCDVQLDATGNFEQQASMSTFSVADEILGEDQRLVLNQGHLLDQSEFSGVSADFISNTQDFIGSGPEESSGLLQHALLAQSVQEFDHINREIDESHVEDAQLQSSNHENPMASNCNCKNCLAVTDDQFPLADVNNDTNEDSHLSHFQKSDAVVDVGWLSTNVASSEEIKKTNLFEDALEGCDIYTSEHNAFNHSHAMHENKDGNLDVDEKSPGLLQHTLLAQSVPEFNHINREIDETHVEDAQVQSFNNENPAAYNCNSKQHCLAVTDDQLSLADDNKNTNEDSHLSDFQKSDAVVVVDWLPTNVASSEEIKKTNLFEDALERCDIYTSEHNAFNHTHVVPENKDENLDLDEKSSGLSQHTLLVQSVPEFNHINREIDETHVEDAQVQSFNNENPAAYNCNSKQHCLAVTDDQFSLADDNKNTNEDSHLSDFQKSDAVVGVDWLPTNVASSEEIKKANLFEDALEGCDIYSGEHNAFNHTHAVPENKDGNLDVVERAELLQMDDAKKGSSDILPLVDIQLNDNIISSEYDPDKEVSKDSTTNVVVWNSEHCSISESSDLPASDNLALKDRIPQGGEVSSLNSEFFSFEADTGISEKDEDMRHQTKDSSSIVLSDESDTNRQEIPTLKPPSNATPFSDEWLAAIEAAGEEVLTMKSGAVQNSPPEKPQHEPGPWSPVKRKNQGIGPFDCTKHNIQNSSS